MTSIPFENESAEEAVLREFLQERLQPGENLLAYTKAKYNPGALSDKEFFVGLTTRGLLLVRRDQKDRAYRLDFHAIRSLSFENAPLSSRKVVQVSLGHESMRLLLPPKWVARGKSLSELYPQAAAAGPGVGSAAGPQSVQLITDLIDLGLTHAAEEVQKELLAQNPMLGSAPAITGEITDGADTLAQMEQNLRQIKETRLAMWVGAGIFILELLFMLAMAALGYAKIGMGIVFAVLAIVGLLRGQVSWRGQALGLAWLTAAVNIIVNIINFSRIDVVMWVAFGLAMWLALAGKASRLRTIAAGAVFAIGFVGMIGMIIILPMISPQTYLTMINGSSSFQDSFDSNRGWDTYTSAEGVMEIENETLGVHPIAADYTSLAVPPIAFAANIAEFDAWIAPGFEQEEGGFGLICHYQDDNNLVMVQVLPQRQGAVLILAQNGDFSALTEPPLQPITNVIGQDAIQYKIDCTGNQVSLYANGALVAQADVPEHTEAEGQTMALFANTGVNTGPNGYKVMFDNVSFSK